MYRSGISFISRQHKRSVYVFIGLHCLLLEAATRAEVFCKKGVPKNFIKSVGKHTRWSLFLIKLQAWHLFWEHLPTTAFALHSHHSLLLICFTLFSAPSSSSLLLLLISLLLLLMSRIFVFGSNSKASKNLILVSHFH